MVALSPTAIAVLALFCAAWLSVAVWATLRGLRLAREGAALRAEAARSEAFLGAAPAIPLLVAADGTAQGGRLAGHLGLSAARAFFSSAASPHPDRKSVV